MFEGLRGSGVQGFRGLGAFRVSRVSWVCGDRVEGAKV